MQSSIMYFNNVSFVMVFHSFFLFSCFHDNKPKTAPNIMPSNTATITKLTNILMSNFALSNNSIKYDKSIAISAEGR